MQLFYIVHSICDASERGQEVRSVFLDIFKAFDKVWHRGLLAKLSALRVQGNLLDWFGSYLTNRQQRVIIDGVSSDWSKLEAGVPQGTVFRPLLLLIFFINPLY